MVANLAEYAGRYRIVPGARATTAGSTSCSSGGGGGATPSASRSTSRAAATSRAPTSRCVPFDAAAPPRALAARGCRPTATPFEAAPPLEMSLAPERLLVLAPARR